jgi:hypothetical protein
VMPRSTADRISEIISCLSLGGPWEKLIPMQPSPRAETSRVAVCQFTLLHVVSPLRCEKQAHWSRAA